VHDQIHPALLEGLAKKHEDDPQALVEALVADAEPDGDGYRDDATAAALLPAVTPSATDR
jgi:hypothetical protein